MMRMSSMSRARMRRTGRRDDEVEEDGLRKMRKT